MTDNADQKPPAKPPRKRVLAKMPEGTAPDVNPEGAVEIEPAPSKPDAGPSVPVSGGETLTLPRRGLVAMRRSGGLRFTSRTVTVFRDGRVKAGSDPVLGPVPDRGLSDEELAELYRALDEAALPELPPTTGRQPPDAYAYELIARLGGKTYSAELFDGSIPEQVAPLISLLARYLRPGD